MSELKVGDGCPDRDGVTSSWNAPRDPPAAPGSGTVLERSRDVQGVEAALAGYPHVASCVVCAEYLSGLLAEVDAHAVDAPFGDDDDRSEPVVPGVADTPLWMCLAARVTPWVLSFHESSHRRDPRRTALEHFGL